MPLLPSRRIAALIAIAGAAFLLSTTFALLLNAVLLVLVVLDGFALHREPVPTVQRTAPPRVPLGGAVSIAVEFGNPADTERRIRWTDDAGVGLSRDDDAQDAVLPARGHLTRQYELRGVQRGRTQLGDLHLRVLGPLQLLWRSCRLPLRNDIVVQPGLLELHRHRVLALHHRLEAGPRRVREVGEGREFERLREYARGDDPRRIDWKATARRGSMIVRQYEAERSQSMMIAIDAGRLMSERFAGRERLDHALSAALVLSDVAGIYGDAVGVMLFADTVQAFLPPGRNPLSRIADVLASVEARRVEPDYPTAFRYLSRQLRRRSLIVLFSDVIDARASATLIEHLGASARRHLPLVVAIRNLELEHAATQAVTDDPAAFRRAAAEELLQARAIALATVRRQGVLIADVRPDAAIGDVMARYLEVKRRGLL
jgi:uncharacterized protein (DUF58 family)